MLFEIGDEPPVANAAAGLHLGRIGLLHSGFAPLEAEVRPLLQDAAFEVLRLVHATEATAAYGHFGRAGFPWEALTHVEALKEAAQQAA